MTDTFVGYRGSNNLKKSGVAIEWTPELIQEFIKCSDDPIYFAENYMKIVNVDKGLITIPLYDYQKEIILTAKDHRFTVAECSRQSGKCVIGETLISIRNKKTGEVLQIPIETFYELCKQKKMNDEKSI